MERLQDLRLVLQSPDPACDRGPELPVAPIGQLIAQHLLRGFHVVNGHRDRESLHAGVNRKPQLDVDPRSRELPTGGGGLPGHILHPHVQDGELAMGDPGSGECRAAGLLVAGDDGGGPPAASTADAVGEDVDPSSSKGLGHAGQLARTVRALHDEDVHVQLLSSRSGPRAQRSPQRGMYAARTP